MGELSPARDARDPSAVPPRPVEGLSAPSRPRRLPEPAEPDGLRGRLRDAVDGITREIVASCEPGREDRLWPADHRALSANPTCLAYGATGIAVALRETTGGLPREAREWMLDRRLDVDTHPPGLFVGLAGIAFAFHRLGHPGRAVEAMRLAYRSPLLFADPGLVYGVAGWGLASLHLHRATGRQEFLDRAVEAGEHLLEAARVEEQGLCWTHSGDGRVHYGLGHGASGIALFLLELGRIAGHGEFTGAARRALSYDLAHRVETETGWEWHRFPGDALVEPYWLHGTAGVGAALVRFARRLGDDRYWRLSEIAAESLFVKFTLVPGQWEGMAGIGELLVDMYAATGEERYRTAALDLAETILWYGVEEDGRLRFPGKVLDRVSADVATGSAGIALFFQRLLDPGPRLFEDMAAGSGAGSSAPRPGAATAPASAADPGAAGPGA